MDTNILKRIGLTEGEVKVYLAVLKTGLTTVGRVIRETKMQSSSVYHIIDSLKEKGLISFEIKNNKKYVFVADPDRLLDFVDDKKQELDKEKINIVKFLPGLHSLRCLSIKPEQEVLIFEGWSGVLSAFKEAYKNIEPGTKIFAYTITKDYGGADPKQVRWLINKVRDLRESMNKKNSKKIVMRLLAETGSEVGEDQAKTKYTKVRFINKKHTNPAVINIYGDITIIALWLKNPIAFYITSKEVAQSFINNFELLWSISNKK
ncbi:MAG: helix-turn-helix domain-containing protein [Candidatus Woesearchaeota archaeon]